MVTPDEFDWAVREAPKVASLLFPTDEAATPWASVEVAKIVNDFETLDELWGDELL